MEKQEYQLCDFCTQPHKKTELETIKITYKKCQDCEPQIQLVNHKNVADTLRLMPTAKKPINLPPPDLAGAFTTPEEMKLTQ